MEEKKITIPKPKLRVQLLDPELRVISDRLVDQSIEFMQGAKVKHTDPIKLEVVLTSKNDIDSLKTYLDQLAGNLPIKEIGTRGRPASTSTKELKSPREDIYQKVEEIAKSENQDAVIKHLRDLGFVFLLTEDFLHYFPDFPFREKDLGKANRNRQYPESYQWLVRRIKMSKDPKADKYDPQIIFGFKMLNNRSDRFVGYLYKEFKGRLKSPIPDKTKLTFASFEMAKLPSFMLEEERLKWSTEMRALMMDKNKKPSKFFLRWAADCILPKGHLEKLSHLNIPFKTE